MITVSVGTALLHVAGTRDQTGKSWSNLYCKNTTLASKVDFSYCILVFVDVHCSKEIVLHGAEATLSLSVV